MSKETNEQKDHGFSPTPWTIILAASLHHGEQKNAALESLCKLYWTPIFAHIRMRGFDLHAAQDLTQEFFSMMLHSNVFANVTAEKGKFRSYLLGSLRHFLINEWRRNQTQKRGGDIGFIHLDALDPAQREACERCDGMDPTLAFDRAWALAVINKVRDRLKGEYDAAAQSERYQALLGYLTLDNSHSYLDTAHELGMTEVAVKSAIFRIRRRFAELLRGEISRTVADPAEVDDEIRHLLTALV